MIKKASVNLLKLKKILPFLLIGLFIFHFFLSTQAQTNVIDSMKLVLTTTDSDSVKGETYFDLCELLAWRDPEIALKYMGTVRQLKLYKELEHWPAWVDYFEGDAYLTKHELDKGEAQVKSAISQFELLKEDLGLAASYHLLGKRAYLDQNWPNAIKYFNEAKNRFSALDKPKGVAGSLNGLGIVYEFSKLWDKAIDTYGEAIDLYQSINNIPGMATNHANRANIHHELKDLAKAKEDYEKALELIRQTSHNEQSLAHINSNYANLLVELKDFEKAKKAAKSGAQFYKSRGSNARAASATINLAFANRETGQLNAARINIEEALSLLEESTDYISLTDATLEAATVYEALGNTQKANAFLREYIVNNDSLMSQEMANQVTELNTKYETEKKEQEITLLNTKNELATTQLSASKKQNIGLGIGLGVFGLLSLFLFSAWRKIGRQNQIISKALGEKEILLKEIHHRVKNNLQIISSLLRIQSRSITDPKAKEAIKEGRSRVRSMALIHEDLYKEDSYSGIQMQNYLGNLVQDIFRVYNVGSDKIKLEVDIDPLQLDVDSVIPLGLIINELITNALKHAFNESSSSSGRSEKNEIKLSLKEEGNHLSLSVSDNGKGFSPSSSDSSFGLTMIETFKEKLEAELEIIGDMGTTILLKIYNYKKNDSAISAA